MKSNFICLSFLLLLRSLQVFYLRLKVRYLLIFKGKALAHDLQGAALIKEIPQPVKEL